MALKQYATDLTEQDAVLIEHSVNPKTGVETLNRKWTDVDASYADELVAYVLANHATYTDPYAAGQKHVGKWVNSRTSEEEGPDRHAAIVQQLTKVTTVASITTINGMTPLVKYSDRDVYPFDRPTGRNQIKELTFLAIDPASRTTIEAFTKATYETSTHRPGTGWEFENAELVDAEDSTISLVVRYRDVTWVSQSETVTVQRGSFDKEKRTITQDEPLPLETSNLSARMTAAYADGTSDRVLRIAGQLTGDGKGQITRESRPVPATTSLGVLAKRKPSKYGKTIEQRVWFDIPIEGATSLSDAVEDAFDGTGDFAAAAGEVIRGAEARDDGDRSGRVTQEVAKNSTPEGLAWLEQDALNPLGFQDGHEEHRVVEIPDVPTTGSFSVGAITFTNVDELIAALRAGWIPGQAKVTTPFKDTITVRGSLQAEDGFLTLRAIEITSDTWDNGDVELLQVAQGNAATWRETTKQATGIPIGTDEEKAAALAKVTGETADSGMALQHVQLSERSNGEAVLTKQQAAANSYGIETVTAPRETEWIPEQAQSQERYEFTWFRVSESRIGTVRDAAKTIGNYAVWGWSSVTGTDWQVARVSPRYYPDGTADIVALVSKTKSDMGWTLIPFHKRTNQIRYEYHVRETDGMWNALKLTYDITYHGDKGDALDAIDGGIKQYSDINHVGNNKWEATRCKSAVWEFTVWMAANLPFAPSKPKP